MDSTVVLKSETDNETVEFDSKFKDFCQNAREAEEDSEIPVPFRKGILQLIKDFYNIHEYNFENVKYQKPLPSGDLKANLGDNSYSVIGHLIDLKNAEDMKDVYEAAYFLQLEDLQQACEVLLATQLINPPSEEEINSFKEKFNIPDLTEEQKKELEDGEYKEVMQKLQDRFEREIEKERQEFLKSN